jgi:nucleoid-associated protein YgaU
VKKLICAAALVSMGVLGCQSHKNGIPSSSTVTDITPAPSAAPAYAPAPQPLAQPVVYDTMTTQTPAAGSTSSGNYTVKKGDTLYSIARSRYGDGKQWTKIVSANPGVRPETLKVGQTITIP